MIFNLRNEKTDKSQGFILFQLYSYCFDCLVLEYRSAELYDRIAQFIGDIRKIHSRKQDASYRKQSRKQLSEKFKDTLTREYASSKKFRVCNINCKYQVCPTYAPIFVVPKDVSDATIRHATKYRARGRLPTLSHQYSNGASIFRSSQPLVGLPRNRSIQDERLLEAMRLTAPRRELIVADARSRASAMANAFNGAGSMLTSHYIGCEQVYLSMDNIHSVRASWAKIYHLMSEGVPLRAAKMEAGWIGHYERLMEGVKSITGWIKNDHYSVLVHCSDGWDRTAQLVSLVQICLYPEARTIDGLIWLIQKEWLSAGHQFELRHAYHSSLNSLSLDISSSTTASISRVFDKFKDSLDDKAYSDPRDEFCPIFPQFLDAMLQLMRVYPNSFEFNQALIDSLWKETFIFETNTFRGNCEKDRDASDDVSCFWSLVDERRHSYTNPSFVPQNEELSINADVLCYL